MNVAISKADIINKLQGNKEFSAGFVVDNNYNDLRRKMAEYGLTVNSEREAYETLLQLGEVDKPRLMKVLDIPYNTNATNYTSGFEDYFIQRTPQNAVRTPEGEGENDGKVGWGALLTTLGGIIGTVATSYLNKGQGGQLTPEQIAELQKQEAEAKAKRNRNIIIAVVVSVVVLGVVIAFAVKSKKK